jgi:hypothetical protein
MLGERLGQQVDLQSFEAQSCSGQSLCAKGQGRRYATTLTTASAAAP